jgi:hypothetical protein
MKKKLLLAFLFVFIIIFISGCFPGTERFKSGTTAGFFTGVWHGWIAPISLIVGLFKDNVRIYELNNTGWWYDFGFYIAIISGFGSVALKRKKKIDE